MSGRLDKGQLEALVASGEIDTVVAAFTDMQGRLIGKRCTGRYFLDAVHEEWHACNYLLTVDMEPQQILSTDQLRHVGRASRRVRSGILPSGTSFDNPTGA